MLEIKSPSETKQPPSRMAVPEEQPDVQQRHGEHHGVERHRPEELAHDDLEVAHGRREQQLDRARSLFLRIGPHRDHRQQEQIENRDVLQQRPNQLLVHVHRLRAAELTHLHALADEELQDGDEEVAVQERPESDHDVRDGRREVRLQLLVSDREDVTHGRFLLRPARRPGSASRRS